MRSNLHMDLRNRLTAKEQQVFKLLLESAKSQEHGSTGNTVIRVAGGWVRDKLLGLQNHDIDVALDDVSGLAFAQVVNAQLKAKGEQTRTIGVIQANPQQSKHLETATVKVLDMPIDFVNLRTESYAQDSRIPEMQFGSAEEDAYRRDFTINALFYNVNTESVEDLTGDGLNDLAQGIIRTPLPPDVTFYDDPLRVLRAVRFASRFGFDLAPAIASAAASDTIHTALIEKVRRERIGSELEGMLTGISNDSYQTCNGNCVSNLCRIFRKVDESQAAKPAADQSDAAQHAASSQAESLQPEGAEREASIAGTPVIGAAAIAKASKQALSTVQPERPIAFLSAALLPVMHMDAIPAELVELTGLEPRPHLTRRQAAKGMSMAQYVVKDGLKLKAKYAQDVVFVHHGVPVFQTLSHKAAAGSLDRLEAGIAVKDARALWRDCVVVACAGELSSVGDLWPHGEVSAGAMATVQRYDALVSQVEHMGLHEAWTIKPLVNGKIMAYTHDEPQPARRRSSRWAQNLTPPGSPRRMRPKVVGMDHLPPRFRRVRPHPSAPAFNFSFACGGWLQFYMFGVAKCLTDHGLHAVDEDQQFIGSSAGALTALGMGIDGCWDTAVNYCKEVLIPKCWATWGGPFSLTSYVRDCAIRTMDLDLATQLRGEVTAVMTRVTPVLRSERVSFFESREHCVDVLLASTAAVPLASAINVDGGWCIDGGLSDFQPRPVPKGNVAETIFVSPFYLVDADIKPSRYVPVWWAFLPPPHSGTIDWLYDLGYRDALLWMQRRGLDFCCDHRRGHDDPVTRDDGAGSLKTANPTPERSPEQAPSRRGSETDIRRVVAASEGILGCKMRPARASHPYDVSNLKGRRFQRLVGYGGGQRVIDRVLDKMLGFWLAVLWRPVALVLIVLEVLLRIVIKTAQACVKEALPAIPATALVAWLLVPSSAALPMLLPLLLAFACSMRALAGGAVAAEDWAQLADYARALKLVIRRRARDIEAPKGRYMEMCSSANTDDIAQHSLVYRTLLHILR
ncbi:hypothetical protein JKP88DRAFT_263026 [Tribonema minus]|uniref:PNPLA domain-containing protein n=1 Tax=Tribonema minus TaxID=303371 RepID=A0A835Z0V0_9STRA|nr:hypothetical protein JKP88DRAFT_263026 [Tribonema minus]